LIGSTAAFQAAKTGSTPVSRSEFKGIDIFSRICLTDSGLLKGGDNVKTLYKVAYYLVIAGALNWGLVGLFKYNLVEALFGGFGLVDLVYDLVGLSGLMVLFGWGKK
jgi:uncharacterized protein